MDKKSEKGKGERRFSLKIFSKLTPEDIKHVKSFSEKIIKESKTLLSRLFFSNTSVDKSRIAFILWLR